MTALRTLTFYFLLTIPVVAGIATLEFETASGNTFTGWIWVLQMVAGLALLVLGLMQPTFGGGFKEWGPWAALTIWIWLSILWCQDLGRRNVQEAMQLSMPLLVGVLAATTIHTRAHLKLLLRMFGVTSVLLAAYVIAYLAGSFDEEWMATRVRPAALTAALVGSVFLAGLSSRRWLSLAGWGLCVLLATLTESRVATFALLSGVVLYPAYRSKAWNIAGFAACAILACLLFYTPIFQERFFEGNSGTLSDVAAGNISGSGRFEAWPAIWNQAWQHPLIGAGVGTAYDFVPTVWKDINHVHNDYLRMFFELGVVGFVLFVGAITWQMVVLYHRVSSTTGVVRIAYSACWLGLWVMLISCATDNTVLYNIYFMNPLFAILGGAYGVTWAEEQASGAVERTPLRNRRVVSTRGRRAAIG